MKLIASLICAGIICAGTLAGCGDSETKQLKAVMYKVTAAGNGAKIGTVTFTDTANGLEVKTDLQDLPPGAHGFHVHENGDCSAAEVNGAFAAAAAAGGHYDPAGAGKHWGPGISDSHLGDLPLLWANQDGTVKTTSVLTSVTINDFRNRSVIIHEESDSYSNNPLSFDGGGIRMACGVIK